MQVFFSEANKHKPELTVFDNSKNLVIFNLNDNDCTIEDMNAVRKVESGDLVLGFTVLNKVNCVGYVESVIVSQPDKVELNINWVKNIASSALSEAVFSQDCSIQYVTEEMINKIDLDLVLIDKLVSKQQKSIGLVTEKMLNQQVMRADSSDEEQNDGGGGSIRVFYGTNRMLTGKMEPNDFYGKEMGEELFLGTCNINIPYTHTQGELERPLVWLLQFKECKGRDIVLDDVTPMKIEGLKDMLRNAFKQSEKKEALVFIHGYNVTFAEAAIRTGQIAWDIPFEGIAGFFSWPSSGTVLSYMADIEKADGSVNAFKRFLCYLFENCGIEKIHIN